MNREKPIRDQAERLRKRVERKTEHAVVKKETLPPRSEIHRQKLKKMKVKVKYPVIRLMALFFILLPITFFSIISYLDGSKGPLDLTSDRAGVEMIDVENGGDSSEIEQESSEDENAPAIEEMTEPEDIDVGSAAPAPKSGSDKNTAVNSGSTKERDGGTNETTEQPATEVSSKPAEGSDSREETIIYHTVQQSETLFRVAMKYYKSQEGIPIIKNANNIQGNEIQAGQVLKIPIKN